MSVSHGSIKYLVHLVNLIALSLRTLGKSTKGPGSRVAAENGEGLEETQQNVVKSPCVYTKGGGASLGEVETKQERND